MLVTFLLLFFCPPILAQKEFTKTILYSKKELEIFILCRDSASFEQTDWLQFGIENRSDQPIFIQDFYYSFNRPERSKEGKVIPNIGSFGRGNKFEVFHIYYGLQDPSSNFRDGIVVDGHSTLMSWKHISDIASVRLEPFVDRIAPSRKVCPEVNLKMSYRAKNKLIELKIPDHQFCFYWKAINYLPDTTLLQRLLGAMNDIYRTGNSYVISRLMKEKKLVEMISTQEFVDALRMHKSGDGEFVNVMYLEELGRRNALPDSQLTVHYSEQLKKGHFPLGELILYWDDLLLEDILRSKSYYGNVANVLERTVDHWKADPIKRRKIYLFLQGKTKFDQTSLPSQDGFKDWSEGLKLLSISRDTLLIPYLATLLENEQSFDFVDWSKYRDCGMIGSRAKPDTISVRICDIAFICLLRVLDQTETNGRVLIKQDLFPLNERIAISPFDSPFYTLLTDTEKYFRLTPGIKAALLAYIEQRKH